MLLFSVYVLVNSQYLTCFFAASSTSCLIRNCHRYQHWRRLSINNRNVYLLTYLLNHLVYCCASERRTSSY